MSESTPHLLQDIYKYLVSQMIADECAGQCSGADKERALLVARVETAIKEITATYY